MFLNSERYIYPSLICLDHLNFESDIELLVNNGINNFHVDVMDGSFVPRFGIYPEIVASAQIKFNISIDLHLMVEDVLRACDLWFDYCVPTQVSFHAYRNERITNQCIEAIQSRGAKCYAAIDLSDPEEWVEETIKQNKFDGYLLMGIIPGVLVQDHRPEAVEQRLSIIRRCSIGTHSIPVQIDGAVNFGTIGRLVGCGATELVCGTSSLFKGCASIEGANRRTCIEENISKIKNLIGS